MLTLAIMQRMWPHGDEKAEGLIEGIVATAPAVFAKYGINSNLLIAHVMAQISLECGAGHELIESLNYSAARMVQVWPSRFPTIASAQPYAHNERALAAKVYNGRMGNRVGSDDGYNYRGRGASQTTGSEGYARLTAETGLDLMLHPELLTDPAHFLECGVADFILCGCLPYAQRDDVVGVTQKLNGGQTNIADRRIWLKNWKAILAVPPAIAVPAPMKDVTPKPMAVTKPDAPPIAAPPSIHNPAPGGLIAGIGLLLSKLFSKK
jgi:putative chitinase